MSELKLRTNSATTKAGADSFAHERCGAPNRTKTRMNFQSTVNPKLYL